MSSPIETPPLDIAGTVSQAWSTHTRTTKGRAPSGQRDYVYASGWRACDRAMALDLLYPEDHVFNDGTLERFYTGDDFERSCRIRMTRAGEQATPPFEVEGTQQRFEVKDRQGRIIIVGKIDGYIHWPSYRLKVPFEVKSGRSVENVNSFADFDLSTWTRPMPRQLLCYMLAMNEAHGLFVLNRPGKPNFLHVALDDQTLEMAEDFLRAAELAVDVRQGKAPMPDFTTNRGECARCDHHGKTCTPPLDYGEGLHLVTDERLIKLAAQVAETHEAAKDHARAKKALAADLKPPREPHQAMTETLIHLGDRFEVTGKWGRSTTFKVPADVKAEFKEVDDHGRWTMTVRALDAGEEGGLADVALAHSVGEEEAARMKAGRAERQRLAAGTDDDDQGGEPGQQTLEGIT